MLCGDQNGFLNTRKYDSFQSQSFKTTFICVSHLGPCIYLRPSLQQQSHHVAVPTLGCYVQRCDVILRRISIIQSFGHTENYLFCQMV